jgi:hypothetical protein
MDELKKDPPALIDFVWCTGRKVDHISILGEKNRERELVCVSQTPLSGGQIEPVPVSWPNNVGLDDSIVRTLLRVETPLFVPKKEQD